MENWESRVTGCPGFMWKIAVETVYGIVGIRGGFASGIGYHVVQKYLLSIW